MKGRHIRALVVDDEPLARRFIRRMLKDESDVEIIGECRNGEEAVAAVRASRPDLMFLDVQMPKMDGFAVLEEIGLEHLPQIIFTTAFEQHAIRAFEMHALDYLLKPFDQARFAAAMRHARERLLHRGELDRRRIFALMERLAQGPARQHRLAVRGAGGIIFLNADEINWIEADDKYVRLHLPGKSHMVRQTMNAVESLLDPQKFIRVHRSAIVNLECVRELHPLFGGECELIMTDGTRLTVSRNYKERLFEQFGKPL